MAAFEIFVNGERRLVDGDISAITLAAEWVSRRDARRVSLHVGVGPTGERHVQYLAADLGPGDEITIRVLPEAPFGWSPELCSFCGREQSEVRSLLASSIIAICVTCLAGFIAVVAHGAPLPIGATIQDRDATPCGFCAKAPPEVPGVLVRNAAAICAECLRACADLTPVGDG